MKTLEINKSYKLIEDNSILEYLGIVEIPNETSFIQCHQFKNEHDDYFYWLYNFKFETIFE